MFPHCSYEAKGQRKEEDSAELSQGRGYGMFSGITLSLKDKNLVIILIK